MSSALNKKKTHLKEITNLIYLKKLNEARSFIIGDPNVIVNRCLTLSAAGIV